MKKASSKNLPKNLIFGVIAISVVLVNCQKAPSRGVKAKGNAGTAATTNGKIENQDVAKMILCNDKIKNALTTQYQTQAQMMEVFKIENLDQAKKAELNALAEKLAGQCNMVRQVFTESKLTACKINYDGTQESARTIEQNNRSCMDYGVAAKNKSNFDNSLSQESTQEETKQQSTEKVDLNHSEIFEAGTAFVVSKDLGELLDSNDQSEVVFVNGVSFNGADALTAAIDKGETACRISQKSDKLKEGSILKLLSITEGKVDVKTKSVVMQMNSIDKAEGGSTYEITCAVAKKDLAQSKAAILKAFGDSFKMTKANEKTQVATAENEEAQAAALVRSGLTAARSGIASSAKKVETTQVETKAHEDEKTQSQTHAQTNVQTEEQAQKELAELSKKADEAVAAQTAKTESTKTETKIESKPVTVQESAQSDLEKAQAALKKQEELDKIAAQKAQAAKTAAEQSAQATIHAAKSAMYADEAKRQQAIAAQKAAEANQWAAVAKAEKEKAEHAQMQKAQESFRKSELLDQKRAANEYRTRSIITEIKSWFN